MKYGLIVDALLDSEEIVVKPLGRHLKDCKCYAGASIMGDGRVVLILDVANFGKIAGLNSVEEKSSRAANIARKAEEAQMSENDLESFLIFSKVLLEILLLSIASRQHPRIADSSHNSKLKRGVKGIAVANHISTTRLQGRMRDRFPTVTKPDPLSLVCQQ